MAWSDEKSQYEIEFLIHHEIHGTYPLEVKSGDHVKSRSLLKYKELYHPTHTVKLSARPGGLMATSDHLLPIYFAARHQDFL